MTTPKTSCHVAGPGTALTYSIDTWVSHTLHQNFRLNSDRSSCAALWLWWNL